ncbi:sulfurtransferase [Azoarcus olearius]|uniref:Sulfurtransferase n=1 Tax=Azoarcus sp. (strain BH72) TaxID=418699 RepID=A1K965_AZOSB|nr:sulfurtransferase [Azoarcus olearius]ANQ85917.1 putative thiosulfate sulfurtransferase [Azoarcus olearius]CAL95370.1 putative thiosulfate sulfurtransferase [Azoarcus olearius]
MNASYATLIGALELAQHLKDPDWVIFDCRFDLANRSFGADAYSRGHLPGAFYLDLEDDLSGPKTGRNGRHPLPDPAKLAARLAACGVGNQTQVVAYDDAAGMFAARLWWLLRWLGHHRVAVLDGGLQAWCRSGQTLSTEEPQARPATFTLALQPGRVDADYVLAHLGKPDMMLIDARSPDRFRGENETLDPVGGHIPGASNRFFRDNLAPDGCFKQASLLREEYGTLLKGRDPHRVVMQCGSAVTACHNLLAMETAGLPGAQLYAGSWSEWCSDPARPVATGAA